MTAKEIKNGVKVTTLERPDGANVTATGEILDERQTGDNEWATDFDLTEPETDGVANAVDIQNYLNHPGYSDEVRTFVYFRDTNTTNGSGVHTTVDWKKHSRYCYITGISLSVSSDGAGAGGERACETGWNGDGSTESADYSDTAWHYVYHRDGYAPEKLSLMGGLHICQREADADPCSGYRLFAADYQQN